ncbi:MAG: hypothetical protein NTW16_00195 [Bacteroidetes bacterium]|nr:hypothetical protein [Bacteroidota bacterium]
MKKLDVITKKLDIIQSLLYQIKDIQTIKNDFDVSDIIKWIDDRNRKRIIKIN